MSDTLIIVGGATISMAALALLTILPFLPARRPLAHRQATPLARLNSLDVQKQRAFLALFAGANRSGQATISGADGQLRFPNFGKAECGWVDDPRDFYSRELPSLGLLEYSETEPRPALGMVPGSTFYTVSIGITADGREAREAWWAEWRTKVDAQAESDDG